MMNNIEKYLDSLDLKNRIRIDSISYLEEIELFCNRNGNTLNSLPSTGQFEQMKLKKNPEDLVKYIKHQYEKRTNKSWKTIVKYKKQREVSTTMFYKFLIYKIHEIYKYIQENYETTECDERGLDIFKLMVNYYIEYLSDNIKICRKGNK